MKLKKLLACLLLIGSMPILAWSQARNPLADGKLRILAIGNSFSVDAVENYLYELFDAAGIDVVIGNMYIGGCTLATHWGKVQNGAESYRYLKIVDGNKIETLNVDLQSAVDDDDWDIITLQQASGSSGQYSTYTPYLANLIEWLGERSNADIWFHQTWAYAQNSDHSEYYKYDNDQMTMYNAIVGAVQQALADNPEIKGVIPSGTAIQNARTSYLGDTFNRDGYHLETTYGRYTAACTWFEALSGQSVVGNAYAPSTIDSQVKALAQNAAHLAVEQPWAVTDMVDFKKPYAQEGPLTSAVQIDFGSNSADASWNYINTLDGEDIYLKDATGTYVSAALTLNPGFDSVFGGVGTEPDDDIISGGIAWPKKVWADSFIVKGTAGEGDSNSACITLSGLEPSQTFTITLLSSRYNGTKSARETNFRLIADSEHEGNIQQGIRIGSGTGQYASWDQVPFDEYSLVFENVKPQSDGCIQLFVKGVDVGSTVVEGHISGLCLTPLAEDGVEAVYIEPGKETDGKVYNLLGSIVDDSYRGIVIKNGKKLLNR